MNRSRGSLRHTALDNLERRGGDLVIGGRTVIAICEELRRTPFYAYDSRAITARVNQLRRVFPPHLQLHYALKANPMPALVRHMAGLVDGFDVASGGEIRVAEEAGMDGSRISFAGPGKSTAELHTAVAAGITIHAESERELVAISRICAESGHRAGVALRVNPDFQLKSAGMKMGGGAAQFGIDAERIPGVLQAWDSQRLDFRGFHIFAGSQNLNAASIIDAQNLTVELAERLAREAPGPVRDLNIGGGFGIPYFPGEQPMDVGLVGENLRRLADKVRASLPQARLIVELGRYLVGEAGYFICRVLDRKLSRGRVFLVTDGGLHHHLAASGNFGQVIRKNYPVVVANRMDHADTEIASVVGPLCTPLDLLADNMELARAEPGDLIAVLQSGAYGFSASPRGFLSHPEPLEVLV